MAMDGGNYRLAATLGEKVISLREATPEDFFDASCAFSRAGDNSKAITYLNMAFTKGYNDFAEMYYSVDLDNIRNDAAYLELEKKYKPDSSVFFGDILELLAKEEKVIIHKKAVFVIPEDYPQESVLKRWSKFVKDSIFNFSNRSLHIRECTFPARREERLSSMQLKTLHLAENKDSHTELVISQTSLDDLIIVSNNGNIMELNEVQCHGVIQIWHNDFESLIIANSTFDFVTRKNNNEIEPSAINGLGYYQMGIHAHNEVSQIALNRSTFRIPEENPTASVLDLSINTKNMLLLGSSFECMVQLSGYCENNLNASGNTFKSFVDFTGFRFPESNVYIPFSQFKSRLVKINSPEEGVYHIKGDSLQHFADSELLDRLVYVYKYLHNNYRVRGELASANACYVSLKELEIAHLRYKENKTGEEVVRMRLNQLMGFYTDYGTSPGKALVISFWIIVLFAIFYFFFPSEWDHSSKRKLIADFRKFIEKNEHGYIKPFFVLMKGFLTSFANALTLSANAFVTLGFGNIPTVGLPRYVCVFQGVLGWLLLSLFSVALINEILL